MPQITLILGALLVLIGVSFYVGTGTSSITALIPAFLGVPILVAGGLAFRQGWRKHAMHVAVLLALLGFLGSARGLLQLPALLSGAELERPAAALAQSITALLCVVFVVLAVNSFIRARRSGGA
jgi:hypothetical protein